MDLARVVQQWLHDPPGLFDAVFAREQLVIPGQPGVQQPLVGLSGSPKSCMNDESRWRSRQRPTSSAVNCSAQSGIGIDPQHDLVGFGPPALGQESQRGNAVR